MNDVIIRLFQSLLETDETMHAFMCERIAIYGTLDYKFFEWYYSKRIHIMSEIIKVLKGDSNDS